MPLYAELKNEPVCGLVRNVRDEENKHTNLDTDGTNNANLVTVTCTHVIRCVILFRVATVEFQLAVCGDNRLCG
jgi:hypothetical protein